MLLEDLIIRLRSKKTIEGLRRKFLPVLPMPPWWSMGKTQSPRRTRPSSGLWEAFPRISSKTNALTVARRAIGLLIVGFPKRKKLVDNVFDAIA